MKKRKKEMQAERKQEESIQPIEEKIDEPDFTFYKKPLIIAIVITAVFYILVFLLVK